MGTRSYAQVAPTSTSMAMNAAIFGYGGHSLVTPHAAVKQLWWTEERINAKVSRKFVLSKLRGEERDFLDRPVMFGEAGEDGLTDDTYLDWILQRAKRLFLILSEVGVPDQIFGCIDDSWDDEDLPISRDDVQYLELAQENDEVINKKFYNTQFVYLLRELTQGSHIDYGPKEHIPMEHVHTNPPAVSLQICDRVHFPGKPEEVFMRRKFALTDKDSGHDYRKGFMRDVQKAQALGHEHVASAWASYTAENSGYIVSDFVGEHTLRSFIDHRMPTQFQRVPAKQRPNLLCEWMHCLSDTLASLHYRGVAHTAIRPSNILINRSNCIAFADIGSLRTFQRMKKVNKVEVYDYGAPELHFPNPELSVSSPPLSSMSAFRKLRKMSSSTSSSSGSSTNGSTRSNSISTTVGSPITPPCTSRSNSIITNTTITGSPTALRPSASFHNFSRRLNRQPSIAASGNISPYSSTTRVMPRSGILSPDMLLDSTEGSDQMSDIYALGCIFLEILTFMIKGKNNEFTKFRTTRVSWSAPNRKRWRNETSFHANADKIDEWMAILSQDCERQSQQIYCGVSDLLKLVKRMMAPNATLRPPAIQVRDRIQQILLSEGGMESLCCAGREWVVIPPPSDQHVTSLRSFYDAMSIATGNMTIPSRGGRESARNESLCEDDMSELTTTESQTGSMRSGKRGSGSTGTTRLSSLRRMFSSSSSLLS